MGMGNRKGIRAIIINLKTKFPFPLGERDSVYIYNQS